MKWLILLTLFTLVSCGKTTTKSSKSIQKVSGLFASTQIRLKVHYEPGAEPYVDKALGFSIWDVTQKNMEALFLGRNPAPAILVPKTLAEMYVLPKFNKTSWSIDDVLSAAKTLESKDKSGVSTFTVLFLNGYSEESKLVIGFHISNTKVIAIFKDVIKSTGNSSTDFQAVEKYVEQATIIHEMGHAIGLVNNGLPMKSSHHDKENQAHCSNPNCVMYYSNEGLDSLKNFVERVKQDQSIIMFDKACLGDAQKYKK